MTAVILQHPAAANLAERITDMRREAWHAEQLWRDLHDGTRDWSEWNPAYAGIYGAQALAADEAYIAWQDALRDLRGLEALVPDGPCPDCTGEKHCKPDCMRYGGIAG